MVERPRGAGYVTAEGRVIFTVSSPGAPQKQKQLSRIIAEMVYGKPLPSSVIVHHLDGDPSNNEKSNLVICQGRGYHGLLHARLRAFRATGDPKQRRCVFCKQYSPIEMMTVKGRTAFAHRQCDAADNRRRYAAKKEQQR